MALDWWFISLTLKILKMGFRDSSNDESIHHHVEGSMGLPHFVDGWFQDSEKWDPKLLKPPLFFQY